MRNFCTTRRAFRANPQGHRARDDGSLPPGGHSRGMNDAHVKDSAAKLGRNWAYSTRLTSQGWVMADLQQLIRQKADLERQIAQLNSKGRQDAIEEIRRIMTEHGLTSDDIASPARARKAGLKLDG